MLPFLPYALGSERADDNCFSTADSEGANILTHRGVTAKRRAVNGGGCRYGAARGCAVIKLATFILGLGRQGGDEDHR